MLQARFREIWQSRFSWIGKHNSLLLLAISGGADSVALAHLLHREGFTLELLHCNFGLRGEESNRDETFVRTLAQKLNVLVHVKHFDTQTYATEARVSIQEAARELRYKWFAVQLNEAETRYPNASPYLVTAHHANDNTETMLFNLFRGTGLKGLTGMEYYRNDLSLLRPLLNCSKDDLLHYLQDIGETFVEDSSNLSNDYTRNFLRNEVLPALQQVFPQVQDNLMHTLHRLKEAAVLYEEAILTRIGKLVIPKGEEWHIPVESWKCQEPQRTITYELLRPFGFSAAQVDHALQLFDAPTGSQLFSPTHRLLRNRNWMIIAPLKVKGEEEPSVQVWEENDDSIQFAGGVLEKMSVTDLSIPANAATSVLIDAAAISEPLVLRKWKQGDYFYPLGMNKKKKLSRFFIDLKLSVLQKEQVWVLLSGERILWVIGLRIDQRCRITPNTKEGLLLHYRAK